jgi:hypothetical protein
MITVGTNGSCSIIPWKNCIPSKYWIWNYSPNGQKLGLVKFEDRQLNGEYWAYITPDSTGKYSSKVKGKWKKGLKVGKWKYYRIVYYPNPLDNSTVYWPKKRILIRKEHYRKGVLVKTKEVK